MPVPYSDDLRWRVVWLHLIDNMSYQDIAKVLYICPKSAQRYIPLFHTTGSVVPVEQKRGPDHCLSDFELYIVFNAFIHNYFCMKHSKNSSTQLVSWYTCQK